MALRLLEQLATLVAAALLLGVPGLAMVSILRLRSAVPDTLVPAAVLVLGLLPAFVATLVHLAVGSSLGLALAVHLLLSAASLAAAIVLGRRRRSRGDRIEPRAAGWSPMTSLLLLVSMVAAWVIRGQVRFDLLYHSSVSRKLAELDHSTFSNINRFADGGPNPAYALPGWHELVAMASRLAGADVLVTWQVLPVLTVGASLLAAAGLARIVTGSRTGETVGALAWFTMRLLYSRREIDGDAVVFGALPGNVVFEIVFPVLFAALLVAVWGETQGVRRRSLALLAAALVATVVLHANYVMYLALAGVGYVVWWLVSGPVTQVLARRTAVAAGVTALVGGGCLAILLPLLAQLENFGNAPEEARIDYHLAARPFGEHVRGGHFYDNLGLGGLLALLLVPVVAARWRTREMYLVAGAMLAYGAFAFVSPIFHLVSSAGSLTVGLRSNHAVAMLLPTVVAAGVLLAAGQLAAWRAAMSRRRWLVGIMTMTGLALVALVLASSRYGYPRFGFNSPGYLSWLLLCALLAWRLVARLRGRVHEAVPAIELELGPDAGGPKDVTRPPLLLVAGIAATVLLGLLVPGGAQSIARAGRYIEPFDDAREAGDLGCLAGPVTEALQRVPPGSTVLSDPVNSFRAMALAPVYVVGDYKVWNAATEDNRTVERLADVNRFFDSSARDEERLAVTRRRDVDYLLLQASDVRWITAYGLDKDRPKRSRRLVPVPGARQLDAFWRAIDRYPDVQAYDGGRTAALVSRHPEVFDLVDWDPRALAGAVPNFRSASTPGEQDGDSDAGEGAEEIDEDACRTYALLRVTHPASGPG